MMGLRGASNTAAVAAVLVAVALLSGCAQATEPTLPKDCPIHPPRSPGLDCDFNACTIATCTPKELLECKVFIDEDINAKYPGGGPLRCENPCLKDSDIWNGDVEFPQLKFVTGDFGCGGIRIRSGYYGSYSYSYPDSLPPVESVKAPVLSTIAGTFIFSDNLLLKTLYLPFLTHVSKLVVERNEKLKLLYTPLLQETSTELVVSHDYELPAVDFLSLEKVGDKLDFDDNTKLKYIGLPKLKEVDDKAKFLANQDLSALVLPELKDVGSNLEFINDYDLKFVAAPKLNDVDGRLNFYAYRYLDGKSDKEQAQRDPTLLFLPSLKEVSDTKISTLDFKGAVIAPSLREGYLQKTADVVLLDNKFDDAHIHNCDSSKSHDGSNCGQPGASGNDGRDGEIILPAAAAAAADAEATSVPTEVPK